MHAFTLAMAKLLGGLQPCSQPVHHNFDTEAEIDQGDPNAGERIAKGG
ncbi:MAG: hypothetical protein HC828_13005 [Blastochloris sp.]|nr:hypothetical protein [Blastochloris sp.]